MPTLLIVHHTTSPSLHSMFEAAHSGATDSRIEGVEVVVQRAESACDDRGKSPDIRLEVQRLVRPGPGSRGPRVPLIGALPTRLP